MLAFPINNYEGKITLIQSVELLSAYVINGRNGYLYNKDKVSMAQSFIIQQLDFHNITENMVKKVFNLKFSLNEMLIQLIGIYTNGK